MNNVYTYYQSVQGMPDAQELINLWADTWQEQGWTPRVLSMRDAMAHPHFKSFMGKVATLPTVNPAGYDLACYIRHMAMQVVGGGLLTDYDVINRGFKPSSLSLPVEPLILEPTRVPCAVLGDTKAFEAICATIWRYTPSRRDDLLPNGRLHVSDMTILRRSQFPALSVCVEYLCSGSSIENDPGDGWRNAPLIHFSTGSICKKGGYGRPKHAVIREVLDGLPAFDGDGQLAANAIPNL